MRIISNFPWGIVVLFIYVTLETEMIIFLLITKLLEHCVLFLCMTNGEAVDKNVIELDFSVSKIAI